MPCHVAVELDWIWYHCGDNSDDDTDDENSRAVIMIKEVIEYQSLDSNDHLIQINIVNTF